MLAWTRRTIKCALAKLGYTLGTKLQGKAGMDFNT